MRPVTAVMTLLLVLGAPAFARAGIYGDDLAKCLVKSASPADQEAFMVWMFSAMSAHHAVHPYANMTSADRDAANKRAAELMQRLLTADCRTEAIAALKYEGRGTLESAFSILGQVGMRGLMSDPAVMKNLQGLDDYIDKSRFEDLGKAAGLPSNPPPAK